MNNLSKPKFNFVGGHPCIDFVNTEILSGGKRKNLLNSFSNFMAWLVQVGLLENEQGLSALKKWQGTTEAETILQEALALRRTLHKMVIQLSEGEGVQKESIKAINVLLSRQVGYEQLEIGRKGFYLKHFRVVDEPAHLLVPIAEAGANLLYDSDYSLIKQCENPECIRFFYDGTRNHSRRWCSMEACGNRMKVAAYYKRSKHKK